MGCDRYWGGVGCVRRILDQQSVGDMDFDVGEPTTGLYGCSMGLDDI